MKIIKLYLVTYDNGEEYEMNDQKDIVIFDSYDKAEEYALSKGFYKTDDKNYFKRKYLKDHEWLKFTDYIFIEEFELNTPKEELN